MKKRWMAAFLTLTLCAAEMLPASAAEDAGSVLQAEDAQAAENIPAEAAEIIEELVPPTEIESETESPSEEATEPSEDELVIDLSDTPDSSVIDLSDASGNTSDALSKDAVDPWDTALATDTATTEIPIDPEHFPDEKFRDYLTSDERKTIQIDTDGNGSLSANEIAAVTELDVTGEATDKVLANKISDLKGIEYFTALTTLQCDNNTLTTLDLSKNTKLECLTCSNNQLTALDLKNNTALFSLVCTGNQIQALDLSENIRLQDLRCADNRLQTLDFSHNSILTWLDCSKNQLSSLDVSNHKNLYYLFCNDNLLTSLSVKGATMLQWLDCSNNQLETLDVTGVLNVNADQDSAVNLLNCAYNKLTELNVGNKSYFKGLVCNNNAITELDLSTNPDLRQLECANNELASLKLPKAASTTSKIKLQTLDCSGNHLTSLDLSSLSITETTVSPNCSGQNVTVSLTETDTGYQADLIPFIGNASPLRLTQEELLADSCTAKSIKGSIFLLTQEGELTDGVLNFTKGAVPETIELIYATGCKVKTDILLEIHLHCHAHTYEELSRTEPTCTENGLLREQCTACGTVTETILPAKGHSYPKDPDSRIEPTCTEDGSLTKICTVCGNIVTQPLAATGHKYRFIKHMPTCTEDGIMYQQCSVCGEKGSETKIPAKGHNFLLISETAATCVTDGVKLEKCSRCGAQNEIISPATGHDYKLVKEVAASCSASGIRVEQCSICGDSKSIILPMTDHEYEQTENIAPTCVSEGIIRKKCRYCNATSVTTLPIVGHSYREFTVVRKATVLAEGLKSRTCSVCGNVETEIIPKLNGAVQLTAVSIPIQIAEKVSVQSLVTGLQEGDCVTSWESDNPEIATISEDGTIVAKKDGTVNISVTTKSGATATMTVQVQKDTVVTEAITGLEKRISLTIGEKLRLKPVLTPISSQEGISYKSSNKKVARVSAKGVVRGLKEGTAKITVSSGNLKFVIKLTVTAPPIQKIKNVPAEKTLRKGKIFLLKPRLALADSSVKFTFRSSDKKVASVTAKGRIRARRKGVAKITVRAGKLKKVCRIIVK